MKKKKGPVKDRRPVKHRPVKHPPVKHRPFKKLRSLRKRPAPATAPPPASAPPPEQFGPEQFDDVAADEGVERVARPAQGRVTPPRREPKIVAPPRRERDHAFSTSTDPRRGTEGRRDDVDPAAVPWLARRDPSASLDLHGLTAEEARRRVHRFVRARAARGDEVVLVITGKGNVIRAQIAAWLTDASVADHIRAFVTAPGQHGGGGAILLLLDAAGPGESAR